LFLLLDIIERRAADRAACRRDHRRAAASIHATPAARPRQCAAAKVRRREIQASLLATCAGEWKHARRVLAAIERDLEERLEIEAAD